MPVEQGGIAGAYVEQVEFGIIGHGIPGGSSAANIPATVGIPGFCSQFQFGMFLPQFRIAGHGEEAPGKFTGFQVIGTDIPAGIVICTGIADNHDITGNFRRTA